jgi:hypothetical protein
MLKVFCGLIYTGNVRHNYAHFPKSEINSEFLQTLFYSKSIPEGCGLIYVLETDENLILRKLEWEAMVHEAHGIVGFDFRIGYFRLILSFIPVQDSQYIPGKQKGLRYHPETIIIKEGGDQREVHFGWQNGKVVILEVDEMNFSEGL